MSNMLVAVYDDPNSVSGASLAQFFRGLFSEKESFQDPCFKDWYVCVGAVEGAYIHSSLELEGGKFILGDFLKLIASADQFDWGDFYIFSNYSDWHSFSYGFENYASLIPKADGLIRAVDSTYIYVFTESKLRNQILDYKIEWESCSEEDTNLFRYPF